MWNAVEQDFQQLYGLDLGEPGLLQARSWRWLRVRLLGLLSTKGRVQRVLYPTEDEKKAREQSQ